MNPKEVLPIDEKGFLERVHHTFIHRQELLRLSVIQDLSFEPSTAEERNAWVHSLQTVLRRIVLETLSLAVSDKINSDADIARCLQIFPSAIESILDSVLSLRGQQCLCRSRIDTLIENGIPIIHVDIVLLCTPQDIFDQMEKSVSGYPDFSLREKPPILDFYDCDRYPGLGSVIEAMMTILNQKIAILDPTLKHAILEIDPQRAWQILYEASILFYKKRNIRNDDGFLEQEFFGNVGPTRPGKGFHAINAIELTALGGMPDGNEELAKLKKKEAIDVKLKVLRGWKMQRGLLLRLIQNRFLGTSKLIGDHPEILEAFEGIEDEILVAGLDIHGDADRTDAFDYLVPPPGFTPRFSLRPLGIGRQIQYGITPLEKEIIEKIGFVIENEWELFVFPESDVKEKRTKLLERKLLIYMHLMVHIGDLVEKYRTSEKQESFVEGLELGALLSEFIGEIRQLSSMMPK